MTRYGWLFWFPLLIIIGIIIYQILLFRKNKMMKKYKRRKDNAAQIAHTKFVRNLPEYKKARKRYNLLLVLSAILYIGAISALTFLSARPISVTESKEEKENRDIVFCLDVSGSMSSYVEGLSNAFIELVKRMDGERFGITIFDGEYVTLSPLSDDYTPLLEILEELKDKKSFHQYASALAYANLSSSSSEIGAGLVGCVDSFDRLGEVERSRMVILATDNIAPSKPIITLEQAGYYAREKDITVYGLNIADTHNQEDLDNNRARSRTKTEIEFQNVATLTGGSYYAMNTFAESGLAPDRIISQIMSQEAARYEGAGQLIRTDSPQIAAIVSTILLVLLILIIWRLYL